MIADTFPEIVPTRTSKIRRLSPKSLKGLIHVFYLSCIEPEGYWNDRESRAQFLSAFAKKMDFDPLNVSNWRNKLPPLRAYGVLMAV